MTFPPSQSVQPTTKKKIRKGTLDSGDSIRSKSAGSAGSTDQPEPISSEFPMVRGNPLVAAKEKGNKLANKAKDKGKLMKPKAKKQTEDKGKKNDVSFESPAMATRSKKVDSCSPAMSTRSKRQLNL
ncbi:hypothetical protein GQ55_4G274400 [Panicum hallii var. hallii]|uniref:Uncharacterized protein n=1 Tax=Panicum hallii var. hallii TaxID=1504633 RepID=A0A2T7E0P5_9POAL|nr:hypothetical protein GQ55_4G274400 [Panicum hallii var. hallii]